MSCSKKDISRPQYFQPGDIFFEGQKHTGQTLHTALIATHIRPAIRGSYTSAF